MTNKDSISPWLIAFIVASSIFWAGYLIGFHDGKELYINHSVNGNQFRTK